MLQSATKLSVGQIDTLYTNLTVQPFKADHAVDIQNEQSILRLTNWFNQLQVINRLQHSFIQGGVVHQNNRLVLRFVLADTYTSYFTLLRGLFEFGKQPHVNISSDRSDKSFNVEIGSDQADSAIAYFENVFTWFAKEIQFKAALKKVIQWEQKVREEQQLVFANFNLAVALTTPSTIKNITVL